MLSQPASLMLLAASRLRVVHCVVPAHVEVHRWCADIGIVLFPDRFLRIRKLQYTAGQNDKLENFTSVVTVQNSDDGKQGGI